MTIENTANRRRDEWLFGGNPKAIERQEAEGQQQLVASRQLPLKGLYEAKCAQYGIRIVGQTSGDPLFVDVELPGDVAMRATEHNMWTELVRNGVVIANIFYKAAFYDHHAFIRWE